MGWAREQAGAVVEALDGCVETPLDLVCGAVDGAEVAVAATSDAAKTGHFEIGSIGKTITATVVASLVVDGILALDDPIGRWLDAGTNADISILELATHRSGLPRLAPNAHDWGDFDPKNPYAGYDADLAEAALRTADRGTPPGTYSNFGFQLLGLVAERADGRPYAEVVASRVFEPLGMNTARISTDHNEPVVGHDAYGPTPRWTQPLPGAGGYEATIGDMTRYASAVLDPDQTPIAAALRLVVEPRFDDDAGGKIGLAWHHHPTQPMVWHNGGTYGFRTCLTVRPDAGRGVVTLANSGELESVDQATALALLDRDPRDARPQPVGTEYDGRLDTLTALVITNDWTSLLAESTEELRNALPVDQFVEAWHDTFDTTSFDSWTIEKRKWIRGAVRAEVSMHGTGPDGGLTLSITDDGLLEGISIR